LPLPTTQKNPKKVFSPTELQSLLRCPKAYALEHETFPKKWPHIESFAKIRGTIFHKAVQFELSDTADITDLYHAEVAAARKRGTIMMEQQLNLEAMIYQVQEYWIYLGEKSIKTIAREVPLQMEYAGVTIKTNGLDAVCSHRTTPSDMVEIHDYKTGNMPSHEVLNRNLQFGLYYILAKRNGYLVNNFWWFKTKDLVRFKSGKRKGERSGEVMYAVQFSALDEDTIYHMTKEAVRLHQSGARPWAGASHIKGGPCEFCEFAMTACPRFTIGLARESRHNRAIDAHEQLLEDKLKEGNR
jgi:hypothetical protein